MVTEASRQIPAVITMTAGIYAYGLSFRVEGSADIAKDAL